MINVYTNLMGMSTVMMILGENITKPDIHIPVQLKAT